MMNLWVNTRMAREALMNKLREEHGLSGMVVTLILVGIAAAVAVVFREQLMSMVKTVFEQTDSVIGAE